MLKIKHLFCTTELYVGLKFLILKVNMYILYRYISKDIYLYSIYMLLFDLELDFDLSRAKDGMLRSELS